MRTKYNVIRTSDGLLVITFTEKRQAERYVHNWNKRYEEKQMDLRLKLIIGDPYLQIVDGKIVTKYANGRKFKGDKK